MGADLLERPHTRRRDCTPCSFRGCEDDAGWVGTPSCAHPQVFCTTHMLRLSALSVRAHCIVCKAVTPGVTISWREWRP